LKPMGEFAWKRGRAHESEKACVNVCEYVCVCVRERERENKRERERERERERVVWVYV